MESTKQDMNEGPPPYAEQPQAAPYQDERLYPTTFHEDSSHQYTPGIRVISPQSYSTAQPFEGYPAMINFVQVPEERECVRPPPSYMGLAIFSCLCCCWPLGLVAIIKSCQVDKAVDRGDMEDASDASRHAKRLALWSIGCGIGIIIAILLRSLLPMLLK